MADRPGWLIGAAALGLVALAGSFRLLAPPDYGQPPIEVVEPGETGLRIDEAGLFANFYPAAGKGPHPGVLLLGGSEGGLGPGAAQMALALQSEGFSVLHQAYFGAPGTPDALERIPLESFGKALEWLEKHPEIHGDRLGLVGVSKGAEAALLAASGSERLAAVVAAAPSSVVWNGVDWGRGGQARQTSWTLAGEDLAAMPYGAWTSGEGLLSIYGLVLDPAHSAEADRAAIPIERVRADVLLICGEAETLWPSCPMAKQLMTRAKSLGGPSIALLAYDDAGHLSFGPPMEPDHPFYDRLGMWGGSPEGNAAARAESWSQAVDFLRVRLGGGDPDAAPGPVGGPSSG